MDAGVSTTKAAALTLMEHLCPSFLKLCFLNQNCYLMFVSLLIFFSLSFSYPVSNCSPVILNLTLLYRLKFCLRTLLTLLWVSMSRLVAFIKGLQLRFITVRCFIWPLHLLFSSASYSIKIELV